MVINSYHRYAVSAIIYRALNKRQRIGVHSSQNDESSLWVMITSVWEQHEPLPNDTVLVDIELTWLLLTAYGLIF